MAADNLKSALEAILFAAGYPVSYEKLAPVLGLDADAVRELAAGMQDDYSERGIKLLVF